jgi:hypothetical protein
MSSFATISQSEMCDEVDAWMAVASPLPESPPGKKNISSFYNILHISNRMKNT